jgi:hypothetical protein
VKSIQPAPLLNGIVRQSEDAPMASSVVTEYEWSAARLILRCDAEAFERLREAVCREGGVSVPITVPSTPLRALSIVLAKDVPPRREGWVRQLVALILALFLVCGPIGLFVLVRWTFVLMGEALGY